MSDEAEAPKGDISIVSMSSQEQCSYLLKTISQHLEQMRSNLTECALIALKTKIDREDQGEVGPLVATNSKDLKRVPLVTLGSAILQSATAISKLSGPDEPDVDSGYILARALVERTINFAYLTVCGEAEFKEWIDYSQQKAFRLLNRNHTAGEAKVHLGVEPPLDASRYEGLKELLGKYTGKSGGEITRWSKLTLNERLGEVDSKFNSASRVVSDLLMSLTYVYEIGAEAQHGTLLGSSIQQGGYSDLFQDGPGMVLVATLQCLDAALHVLAAFNERPDWAEAAKTTTHEMFIVDGRS